MTRIELGGEGIPIPTEALPDGLVEGALTPLTFTFNEDGSFDKTQWTPFGFTIFEIFCVGGAGGRGGFGRHIFGAGSNAPWTIQGTGGGGGGGGMHYIAGLLADLDDISAVVVGLAGAHGSDGPFNYNDLALDPGEPGEDGGFSSFADDLCMASGGKGGKVWQATRILDPGGTGSYVITYRLGGDGGDGGVGGQTAAGGGASGAVSALTGESSSHGPFWGSDTGDQGFWDESIGEGGGGGMGWFDRSFGSGGDAFWVPFDGTIDFSTIPDNSTRAQHASTEGGRGSFNYADSSKHGIKGNQPDRVWSTINPYTPKTFRLPEAGGGGGARPTALAKYGAYADGYSPNGVVIVRIS